MLKASNLVYEYGLAAFILQPFSFLPLKTLVINAAKSQLSFPLLLLCVFVGRASRNFLTAALALIIGKYFGKTIAQKPYLWLIAWAIFAGSIIAWSMTRV